MDSEETFEWYAGYALCKPDGYPRLQVSVYADAGAAGSQAARAAIQQVACLKGWKTNPENTEERGDTFHSPPSVSKARKQSLGGRGFWPHASVHLLSLSIHTCASLSTTTICRIRRPDSGPADGLLAASDGLCSILHAGFVESPFPGTSVNKLRSRTA